jgi:hypothetical protein
MFAVLAQGTTMKTKKSLPNRGLWTWLFGGGYDGAGGRG